VPKIQALASQTATTFAFFNNHPRGQAAANAFMMRHALGLPVGRIPKSLVEHYPLLQPLVEAGSPGIAAP